MNSSETRDRKRIVASGTTKEAPNLGILEDKLIEQRRHRSRVRKVSFL